MNKKSMGKIGKISILSVVIILVFFLLFSLGFLIAANLDEKYELGDKIKIDLSGNYKAKITTPSNSYIVQGKDSLIINTEEIGFYHIEVKRKWRTKKYSFEVVNSLNQEFNLIEENFENNNSNKMTPLKNDSVINDYFDNSLEEVIQGEAKIGSDVMWTQVIGGIENKYHTKGPIVKSEKIKNNKKEIVILSNTSYRDVEVYTNFSESVENINHLRVYWKNKNQYLGFNAIDENDDEILDKIEWVIPELENNSEQIFEIIVITGAEHLNKDKEIITNVYEQVREQDDNWVLVGNNEYIKVYFEKNLTSNNDITLYARGFGEVLVYDENEKYIMSFNITGEDRYRELLTEMKGSEDIFYLRVLGSIELDLIIDPITGGTSSGGLRPQSVICYQEGALGSCDGTYPTACPGSGGSDYLSCNDGNQESHGSKKNLYAQINATYYDTSVTDCVELTNVSIVYEWSNGAGFYSCSLDFDSGGDDSWSGIESTCPGAGSIGTFDATNAGTESWSCSSFFTASGTRASARAIGTSDSKNSQQLTIDQLWYNISYNTAGSLNINLTEPSTISVNTKTINTNFTVNASLTCIGTGDDVCGDVEAMIRYNSTTASPDTQINTSLGASPFYTTANITCNKLNSTGGENTCDVVWEVNATEVGNWLIDVYAEPEFSLVASNNTDDAEIATRQGANLNVNLTYPLLDPQISESENFQLNCTAYCSGQDCINVEVYPIFCDTPSCSPDEYITTGSSGLNSDVNSINLGTITTDTNENASFVITGDYGDYVVSCNSTSDNAGNPVSLVETQIHVNDEPIAAFFYPSDLEWLSASETLDGGSSTDSENNITNYKFEIDDNLGFSSPTTICDGASTTCLLDTDSQSECAKETNSCYLRLNVTDNYTKYNSTVIQIGIDNNGSYTIMGNPENDTYVITDNYRINASASDLGSGVDCVEFEFYNGSWNLIGVNCSSSPYAYSWDLSSIPDQVLQVRARANDSEGNFGNYSVHSNVTHDTAIPIAIFDNPLNDEIINTSSYLLNASSSYDLTSGLKNASFYYYNITTGLWDLIGSDLDSSDGLTYNWIIDVQDGVYNLSVNVSDAASLLNSTIISNITIDLQNDNPACTIIYPNGAEELNGNVMVSASSSEADPSDFVDNVSFEYSTNNGTSWNLIGVNNSNDLINYNYLWSTTGDIDNINYSIRCNVTDSRNGKSNDVTDNNFTIDNTAPLWTNDNINATDFSIGESICINITVSDNIVGVDLVLAEIDYPAGPNVNISLNDAGINCDSLASDGIYSSSIELSLDGIHNWTKVYINDTLGNPNMSIIGKNWSVTSDSYLISEILYPLSNIEVNESGINTNFTVSCNITCNESGGACNDVVISAEYNPGVWEDITTVTSDLVNAENDYSCGSLAKGEECNHTFNISAGINSGDNTWDLRCHGASSNAAADFSDLVVNVHVNDFPTANFIYPSEFEWLSGVEILNGSASSDLDGTLDNYHFEIDDNLGFATPVTLCDSSLDNCDLNTETQIECAQETSNCYLRLTVTDDDDTINSTIIQVGIDNNGSLVDLELPINDSYIASESTIINASANDLGSGVDCVEFEFYNGTWNLLNVDCFSLYFYNWDLSDVPDQILQVRARANDSEGNFGNYSVHGNITHDTTPPLVNLDYPKVDDFVNSSIIIFNASSSDNLASIFSCELILDGVVNKTNSTVINDSLFEFNVSGISNGLHNYSINCSDNAGNENNGGLRNFTVDLIFPVVNLEFPQNYFWLDNGGIDFNYSIIETHSDSCNLWGNWSEGWHLNATNTNPTNITTNNFTLNLPDGSYLWNVQCNDSSGNYKFNLSNYTIYIDTKFPDISYNPNTDENDSIKGKNWVFINISASDLNLESVILEWQGVNESFENNSGSFYWENKTGLADGIYYFRVYINDSSGNTNLTLERQVYVDLIPATYSNQNQTVGGNYTNIFHRGDVMNLSINWSDVYNLNYSILETNETGVWDNKSDYSSPYALISNQSNIGFNWTNNSVALGSWIGWRAYANDSVGNLNVTEIMSFQVWGWSKVSGAFLNPSGIDEEEETTMNCLIVDNITSNPIQGHNVSFYNSTQYMGSNITGLNGNAKYSFNESVPGSHLITCNISDNSSLYYNSSYQNQGSDNLGVGFQLNIYDHTDTTYNKAYEGITNTTTTQIGDTESYTSLLYNDTDYQEYRTKTGTEEGEYAYTRFEFNFTEPVEGITKINMTWQGNGTIGTGTPGFILYWFNWTNNSWQERINVDNDPTEHRENITYEEIDFSDFVATNGSFMVLARSQNPSATTQGGALRWVEIATNVIFVEVYADIIPPEVSLIIPINYYNSTSEVINFNCYVNDDHNVDFVELYGNWTTSWHLNETNSSQLRDVNYSFTKNISEGSYIWNCRACDKAGNCEATSLNWTFNIDLTAPIVNLIYPNLTQNFSGYTIDRFNFSANDNNDINNCSLYGNWTGWQKNQTINEVVENFNTNFSSIAVADDGYYSWNVYCLDYAGNIGYNSTNYSFSAFLPPDKPILYSANQTDNDGTGDVILYWNSSNHSNKYRIYYGDDLNTFNYLGETANLNYTDTLFSGNKRRFYRIDSWNPIGQNESLNYFGSHVYTLKHNGNTRNWIGIPVNATYLNYANDSLGNINNATAITMWNATTQKRVTCNTYSCPDSYECTDSNCNFSFDLSSGRGYEVNINSSAPSEINWSTVGIVLPPLTISLNKNSSDFAKNWVAMQANTTLNTATDLHSSVINADTVSDWNESTQKSEGLAVIGPIPFGTNFDINIEGGYEVSITANEDWTQE
jgi:hypothetical protein